MVVSMTTIFGYTVMYEPKYKNLYIYGNITTIAYPIQHTVPQCTNHAPKQF